MPGCLVGVEGGGSSTKVIVVDGDTLGTLVYRYFPVSSNVYALGLAAVDNIAACVQEALQGLR